MSPLETLSPNTLFLGEAVVRILGAFVLLNIFSAGIWCILKGIGTHKKMQRLMLVRGQTNRGKGLFGAYISWHWNGSEFWSADPYFFALASKEVIPIRVNSLGVDHKLDIWTHNGKGRIAVGILFCILAIALAFKLT